MANAMTANDVSDEDDENPMSMSLGPVVIGDAISFVGMVTVIGMT